MINFKKEIAKLISDVTNIDKSDIESNVVVPKESSSMGDYSFTCFNLAKILKKSPMVIAEQLKEEIDKPYFIDKIENVNGYLNFYLNREEVAKTVFSEFEEKQEEYGRSNVGEGKTILVEYSSPNIAKPFHIGHLRTTVIGHALYNIYKFLGYNTIGINHLGDYGTQFGKLIEAYKRWGNEYDIDSNPIDELTKMYIRINKLCDEDESVLNNCRNNFKLLEEKDEYCTNLWEKFRSVSLKEFQKTYDLLGIKFDSIRGEAFYIDKIDEVINILDKNNKLTKSEGALVVDLKDDGIDTPCIVKKSDGSSIYATRDLATILYRSRTYDYDKSIYVTGYEQDFHFNQVFKVAKYLDLDDKYVKGLEHVSYGMYSLKEGKMSTRKGNFIKLEDILNESISKAKQIITEKNPNLDEIDDISKKVGIGAVVFSDLYNSRIKDEVFDIDEMLSFQGETCPYIQYMYVRINSILSKTDEKVLINELNYSKLSDEQSYSIVKLLYNFTDVIEQAAAKNEPYILSRYLIDLAKHYSLFYSKNKVLSDDLDERHARLYLINIVGTVLRKGLEILGIKMPSKM